MSGRWPDAVALKPQIEAAANVVVIGGGFIGLECAAVARTLGCKVVVLEAMDRLMARVVSPVLSDYYRDLHRGRGVDVRLGASVTEIVGSGGRVTGVRCGDGATVPADLVVVGIGIIANDDLAKAAGLHLRPRHRGRCASCAPPIRDIYAIGDCAAFPHPMAQGLVRLELVQNAIDQGKTVADAIMGDAKPYAAVPWFWSDQYEVKLQIVGLTQHYDDTVTLGDVAGGRFSVLYFRKRRIDRHRFREHAERSRRRPQAVRRRQDGADRRRRAPPDSACGHRFSDQSPVSRLATTLPA